MSLRSALVAAACGVALLALPTAAQAAKASPGNCKAATKATVLSGKLEVAELEYGPDTLNPRTAKGWAPAPKMLRHPRPNKPSVTFYRAVTRTVLSYGGGRYTFAAGSIFYNVNCYSYYAVGDTNQHPSISLETGQAKVETHGAKTGLLTFDVFTTYDASGTYTVSRTRKSTKNPFGTTKVKAANVLQVNLLHQSNGNCHYVRQATYTTSIGSHGVKISEKVQRR